MLHQNNLLTIARYSAIMNYVSSKFGQKCYLRIAFIGMINRNLGIRLEKDAHIVAPKLSYFFYDIYKIITITLAASCPE